MKDILPAGWIPSAPVTQIVCAFNPQIQHLPDPSKDGVMGAGLAGQLYLIAANDQFTDVNGDLIVMAEDITPRAPGLPAAMTEVWHFDCATLRRLKSTDERFGACYALFLPYPPNWKDVTEIRISTQYKPKGDKEPTLPGPPQKVLLDFTPPGEQSDVWLKKDGTKPTAPMAIKGIPNVARDIARGGWTAPLTGPQTNSTTVPAGGVPPASTGPLMPATGTGPLPPAGMVPFAPPQGTSPPPANMSSLPPPMTFTPDRPQASVRGPNGETLNVTAMALPPGQSMPNGWQKQADGSIKRVEGNTPAASDLAPQQQQWQPPTQQGSSTPPPNYVPASERYRTPSEQYQSRIQHGAFNQPQQPQTGLSGSLPAIPASVVPPQRQPLPIPNVPAGNTPAIPTTPSGVSGSSTPLQIPPAPGFDPNSPVGVWANQPPAPPSGVGGTPTVLPPSNPDHLPVVPVLPPR